MAGINDDTILDPTPLTGPTGPPGPATTYTNPAPTPVAHGGLPAGSTFAGMTMQQMFDAILYPYQYPAFSSFSIQAQANPLEVGNSIPAGVTFLWGTTNPGNVQANSLVIRDVTNAIDLAIGLADDGSEAVVMGGPITKAAPATHTFRITGINTLLGTFQRDAVYSWLWRVFAGVSANAALTEPEIEALADFSQLSNTFARTYNMSAGGYKYVCYPSSFGWATSWKDQLTGFNIPFVNIGTVSVTNPFGANINYNVQRSSNILGGAVDIIVA